MWEFIYSTALDKWYGFRIVRDAIIDLPFSLTKVENWFTSPNWKVNICFFIKAVASPRFCILDLSTYHISWARLKNLLGNTRNTEVHEYVVHTRFDTS